MHHDPKPATDPTDLATMGRRLGALVAREAMITLANEREAAEVTISLVHPRSAAHAFTCATVAEAVGEAWAWACKHDPALVGEGQLAGLP